MEDEEDIYIKYLKLYLREILEAFIAISVVRYIMEKELKLLDLLRASIIIGTVTFILENYSTDLKTNVTQGITFTVGNTLISKFTVD